MAQAVLHAALALLKTPLTVATVETDLGTLLASGGATLAAIAFLRFQVCGA